MTKSAKHKKEFRKEKNKIKLKLTFKTEKSARKKGSLLPKGLNVTDTSFKTKKIVLPDNLRPTEDSGIPLSNRKQSFKELLSHMGHFNAGVQQDGINGMKELLVKFPGVLEINMGPLLGKLSELMSMKDSAVRKCALKLLDHVIQSTPAEKIMPFFPLLNAQLMCCMNHISLDIQKDSHLLLDILLTHVPSLVATVTMQILPNFLEQISCRDDSKTGKRILTINPNQRLTSLKWRQEVLVRIHRLLTLLLSKSESDPRNANILTNFGYGNPCPVYTKRDFNVTLNIQRPGYFAVNETTSASHCLQKFSSHLFPLLIETWVEAMASEQLNKNQGFSLIGPESLALLACITNVMFTLWNIMNQSENHAELLSWFEQQCGEPLIRNFIQRFPFSARIESVRNKKQGDPQCREQNLILCFIWAQLEMKSAAKYAPFVFQYISGLFLSADQSILMPSELDQLKNILLSCCKKKNLKIHVNSVIEAAVEFSNRVRPDRKDRLLLNRTLLNIGEIVGEGGDIPSLNRWVETCPVVLRDNTNMELLESVNRVMSRNAVCLANGRNELDHLLLNLEKLGGKFEYWKPVFDFIYLTTKDIPNRVAIDVLQQYTDRLQDPAVKSYGRGVLNIIGAKT